MTNTKRCMIALVVAGCGGGPAHSTMPSNEVAVTAEESEPIKGKPDGDALARLEAFDQARAAGVLGSLSPNPCAANPCAADPGAANPCATAAAYPQVAVGLPTASRSKDDIRGVVRANLKYIQFCYEKLLLVKPTLAGTSTTQFVIGMDGKVMTATSTGFDPDVDACLADKIKAYFVFSTASGVTTVNYPFTFKPEPPAP